MTHPLNIPTSRKVLILTFFLLVSIIGLMIKLPPIFRSIDKEMHFLFFFFSAAFLNVLFGNGKVVPHIVIFIALLFFGYFIEHAQEFSNRFFAKRIHGNFDPEDLKYNIMGLSLFSVLWFFNATTFKLFHFLFKRNPHD
jgi:hypothetical protein